MFAKDHCCTMHLAVTACGVPSLALVAVVLCTGCGSTPLVPSPAPVGAANTRYVDGTLGSDSNAGSIGSPFATIHACLGAVTDGQTCLVASGIYPEMIVPQRDNVTVAAAAGAIVTITAADIVTGWTAQGHGIYAAPVTVNIAVPARDGRAQLFPGMQLFYNEAGVPQAQWPSPSGDPLHPHWGIIATATPETQLVNNEPVVIPATITDPNAPALTTAGAVIHLWSGSDPYEEYAGQVTSAPGGSITYANEGAFDTNTAKPGGLYYLVGGPELITQNTWAYDATRQILYWQPPAGVNPNQADVRFKQRYATVDLSGRSKIVLEDLQFIGGGILMDANSSGNVLTGISATYLSSVQQSHSNGPSDHEDFYSFGVLLDGTNNTLQNSTIAYAALNAVTLHGSGNTVTNSLIHDVDTFGNGAAGIYVGDGVADTTGAVITHNTIYNAGRAGITLALNPDVGTGAATTHVYGAQIAGNNLFNTMLLAADGGAIYTCCADVTTGTVIENNWIHGEIAPASLTFPKSSTAPHPWAGIYWDNGAGGVQVINNVIWNSFPELFLHGDLYASGTPVETVNVVMANNTLPDATNGCSVQASALAQAANVTIENNQTYYQLFSRNAPGTVLTAQNNSPGAAGAAAFAIPGCSVAGCTVGLTPPVFPANAPAQGATPTCP